MKHYGKRLLSLGLALTMSVGMGVVSSAATATSATYGVTVKDNTIYFTQNGTNVGNFKSRDGKLNLTTDKDSDFVLCYYDTNNTYRAVNLAKQTSLVVSGKMDTLAIAAGLDDKIAITTGSNSDIGTVKVASPNAVRIDGKVGTLSATAAAQITLGSSSKVTTKSITKTAKVTTEKGAQAGSTTVPKASSSSRASSTKSSSTGSSSSGNLRLTVDSIDAEDGDRLRDLLDELEDNVYVYDRSTDDEVTGTCEWSSAGNRTVEKDGSFSFTFYPDNSKYDSIKGSVKIYVDGAHGDIDLVFSKSTADMPKDSDIKDLIEWLEDNVYAEDSNGDDVDGSFKIGSHKNSDKIRSRSYSFTFKPKSSKYNNEDDSITVVVAS